MGVAFEIFLKKNKKNIVSKGEEENEEQEVNRKRKRGTASTTGGTHNSKKRKQGGEEEDTDADTNAKNPKDRSDEQQDTQGEDVSGEEWPELEAYISILEEGPLCPINFDPTDSRNINNKKKSKTTTTTTPDEETIEMPHGPDGLRYHIIDIWLDELAKVIDTDEKDAHTVRPDIDGGKEEEREGEASNGTSRNSKNISSNIPIDLLLRPFEKLKSQSPTKTVRLRASEVLDDERLIEWGFRTKRVNNDEDDEDDEDDEWGGFGD